jgi:hypothetical protein
MRIPLLLPVLGLLACCSHAQVVDTSTLTGKVVCGYQGWFRCEGDGSNNGWHHYAANGGFEPGRAHIDLWPDVSELPPQDRFKTPFKHADGRPAMVFSSVRESVAKLHFKWMRDHGIDGAMLQRFATGTRNPRSRESLDRVLTNCQAAAAANGRGWALMYDLSGLKQGEAKLVISDWKHLLTNKLLARKGPAYFHHHGKPLVALWGLGFKDRAPQLDEWASLIAFLRDDPEFGGCAILLGVPYHWRSQKADAIADPRLLDLIARADIVSPWAVGRLATPQDAANRVAANLQPDLAWCAARKLDYLPVVFPGFSWQNLSAARKEEAKFNAIPRRGGEFLWAQALAAKRAGSRMIYVAMFDELDEGTAIFKTDNDPPVGASRFLAEPGLPNDHYLWLTGMLGKLLRDEIPPTSGMPRRTRP